MTVYIATSAPPTWACNGELGDKRAWDVFFDGHRITVYSEPVFRSHEHIAAVSDYVLTTTPDLESLGEHLQGAAEKAALDRGCPMPPGNAPYIHAYPEVEMVECTWRWWSVEMTDEDDRPGGYPCCKHCFEPGRPVAIHETPCRMCKQEED